MHECEESGLDDDSQNVQFPTLLPTGLDKSQTQQSLVDANAQNTEDSANVELAVWVVEDGHDAAEPTEGQSPYEDVYNQLPCLLQSNICPIVPLILWVASFLVIIGRVGL